MSEVISWLPVLLFLAPFSMLIYMKWSFDKYWGSLQESAKIEEFRETLERIYHK